MRSHLESIKKGLRHPSHKVLGQLMKVESSGEVCKGKVRGNKNQGKMALEQKIRNQIMK